MPTIMIRNFMLALIKEKLAIKLQKITFSKVKNKLKNWRQAKRDAERCKRRNVDGIERY
ncbi:MAG: hypothetical protein ACEY3J_01740 [Arsenophonus sp.]